MSFAVSSKPIFSADESGVKLLVDVETIDVETIEAEPILPSPPETPLSQATGTTTTTITTTTTTTTIITTATPTKRRCRASADSPSEIRARKRARRVARRNSPPAVAANNEPRLWDIDSGLRPTKGQAFREYLGEDLILHPTAAVFKELHAKETEEARDRREDREFDAACQAESKFSRWHFEWFETLLEEELTAEEAVALAYQIGLIY